MAGWIGLLVLSCLSLAPAQEPEVLDATNVEALRTHVGQDVVVEGPVTDLGKTKTNSITFINIGLPRKQGFVAVIFEKNYAAFPEGFDSYKGQTLRVSGKLDLYQGEQPQIEVRAPEQIQIVHPQ